MRQSQEIVLGKAVKASEARFRRLFCSNKVHDRKRRLTGPPRKCCGENRLEIAGRKGSCKSRAGEPRSSGASRFKENCSQPRQSRSSQERRGREQRGRCTRENLFRGSSRVNGFRHAPSALAGPALHAQASLCRFDVRAPLLPPPVTLVSPLGHFLLLQSLGSNPWIKMACKILYLISKLYVKLSDVFGKNSRSSARRRHENSPYPVRQARPTRVRYVRLVIGGHHAAWCPPITRANGVARGHL